MSKYQKEAEALGITKTSTGKSKYASEHNLLKSTGTILSDEAALAAQQHDFSGQLAVSEMPSMDFRKSELMQNIEQQPEPTQSKYAEERSSFQKGLDTVLAIPGAIDRNVKAFSDAAANKLTFGLHNKIGRYLEDQGVDEQMDTQDSIAGTAGAITGEVLGVGKLYGLAGKGLARLAPNLTNRIARTGILGATAGTAYQTGQEVADLAFDTREDGGQSLGTRGLNIAKEGALYGATDLALLGAGRGIRAARRALPGSLGSATVKGGGELSSAAASRSLRTNATEPLEQQIGRAVTKTDETIPEGVRSAKSKYDAERAVTKSDEALLQAESAQPMKQNWFTNLFGNTGVGISPFGSSKRIGDKPLTTKDAIVKKSIKNDVDGVKASVAATGRAAYQNFVDALSPLKRVNAETYDTVIDAARANNIANNIIGKDFVTPEGVRIGDGLESIFGKVGRGQDKNFIDYLILRDAATRVARGERVYDESLGMTPEKIMQRIANYDRQYPGFAAISKDWDAFTKNLRETFGINEGLITPAQNAAMEASRPFYAPMRRQFSKSEKPGRQFLQSSSGSAFSGQKAPIKKVSPTGSIRGIVDPRKTMIEAVGAWTNAAMRNRPMQELVKSIRANPEGMKHIAEIVPETAEATQKSLKEINDILSNDGMEGLLERLNSDFDLAFKKGAQKGTDDNIVRAMVDGQPVRVRVHDPEIVKAVTAMGPQQSGLIIDLFTTLSNATKRGATGALAPLFAARSVTTDLVQSLIQAKNPAQHSVDLVHAIFSSIGDKFNIPGLGNLAKEFRRAGGEYSAALRGERQLNKSLGRLRRDPILSPRNVARQTGRLIASPFKLGEAISDVSENVNRIAAYKGEMRRLGGVRTPENVRKAITEGREITTNFSRKGAFSKELEALFPYQNAAVQGTHRIMRGFKDNPIKTTAAVFTLSVLPKMFEYSQFHDDPDYQKLPARERMRNLIIDKNEDGTFIKIPMEPAYNSFGEMTIQTLRYLKDNDTKAFKGTLDALANAWTPPLLTGALQGATQGTGPEGSLTGTLGSMAGAPFTSVMANKDFAGRPIESMALSDRSPQNRYDERTSSIAKQLGQLADMSPKKIDYLLRSYGGDPARLLLPLTSDVGAGTPRNVLLRNWIVDPQITNTLTDDFYKGKESITQAYRDNQEVGAPLPSWFSEELRKYATSTARGSASKRIPELNDKKKEINANKTLSAQQKSDQLRDIQRQMNEIYADVNLRMIEAGVPLPNR